MELILNMLAEAAVTEISQNENSKGEKQSAMVAVSGAKVVLDARKSLERRGGMAITPKNTKEIGTKQLPFDEKKVDF